MYHVLCACVSQRLMSVWKGLISVYRTVTTHLVHTSALVTVVSSLILMEELVMVRLTTVERIVL